MAIDPPWRFDPFQNLVNVKWEKGETSTGGDLYHASASYGIQLVYYNGVSWRIGISCDSISAGATYLGSIPQHSFMYIGQVTPEFPDNWHQLLSDISVSGSSVVLHLYASHDYGTSSCDFSGESIKSPWGAVAVFKNISSVSKQEPWNWGVMVEFEEIG